MVIISFYEEPVVALLSSEVAVKIKDLILIGTYSQTLILLFVLFTFWLSSYHTDRK